MDAWGAEFYQKLVESCPKQETLRGGKVIPGAFAFMMHEDMGKVCMATPDGRLAGEAFNGGSDPVSGRDIKGPTASLLSTTTWDQRPFLGGIAVNMRLNLSGNTIGNKMTRPVGVRQCRKALNCKQTKTWC